MELVIGGKYNFICLEEVMVYLGKVDGWHQFALEVDLDKVWSELLDIELHLIEAVS